MVCFLLNAGTTVFATEDSLSLRTLNCKFSLSSSYNTFSNWSAGSHDNFSFQGNADINYMAQRSRFRRQCTFRTMLNYMKYVDSMWIKAADYWKLSLRITDQPSKHLTHVYSFQLSSQWLNSYRYVRRNDKLEKEKRGGLLNPGTATLAYGVNWRFWKSSSVSFTFATVKISTRPRYGPLLGGEEDFARTGKAYILSEYGMGLQTCIEKNLTPSILWENNSSFFANGIGKNRVQGDFINAVSFRFLRFLEFRVDTQIIYDPLVSYKLQFLHGFRVGFLLDVRNGKVNTAMRN